MIGNTSKVVFVEKDLGRSHSNSIGIRLSRLRIRFNNSRKEIADMMRSTVLAMMLGLMMSASGGVLAGDGVADQEKSLGKKKDMVALSESERDEVKLAATLLVEMADRGLYKEVWSGMLAEFRDTNDFRGFERLLAFRKKMIIPVDYRKLAVVEAVEVSAPGFGHGRFAAAVFCARSEGITFVETIILKQETGRTWTPASIKFKVDDSAGDGENPKSGDKEGPCAYLAAGGMGA